MCQVWAAATLSCNSCDALMHPSAWRQTLTRDGYWCRCWQDISHQHHLQADGARPGRNLHRWSGGCQIRIGSAQELYGHYPTGLHPLPTPPPSSPAIDLTGASSEGPICPYQLPVFNCPCHVEGSCGQAKMPAVTDSTTHLQSASVGFDTRFV